MVDMNTPISEIRSLEYGPHMAGIFLRLNHGEVEISARH